METNLLAKWCRICSLEFDDSGMIYLFGEEARRSFLQAKIRRYLALTISIEDKLPKMICPDCCRKLESFHKFATMALRNQEKMTKFILQSKNSNNNNSHILEEKHTENKSLLHTYLTKGIKEKELLLTHHHQQQDEVTEMEVRIDPMLILQCSLDNDDDDDNSSELLPSAASSDEIIKSRLKINSNTNLKYESENYEPPYLCATCLRTFTTEMALQNHMWNHSSVYQKKTTNVLVNNFHDSNELFLLNRRIHGDDNKDNIDDDNDDNEEEKMTEEEHETSIISNEYIDDNDEYAMNNNNKLLSCPICGKIISTKGNLKVHLETHRPKGKYGCDICGRIFKTQCNLYRHKEYHGGVQYPCGVCGRVYPTNSTLRAHSITHSDLRPHKCPLCDKTFKRNQDLKFHINQHTGARPYQCPYCPKAFASSGNCFSHRKRMHPIEVERDRERAARIMR